MAKIADAFGEITNILVGCCSNQFKTGFPLKLNLKKETLETFVPTQVDLTSTVPFEAEEYYLLSTQIRMEDRIYGPLEIIFPSETLGLPKLTAGRERVSGKKGLLNRNLINLKAGNRVQDKKPTLFSITMDITIKLGSFRSSARISRNLRFYRKISLRKMLKLCCYRLRVI
jgi:hypothetical protein